MQLDKQESRADALESVRTPTILARFRNPPSFDAPTRGIPSEFLDETYTANRKGMGLLYGENCTTLTSTIFDRSTCVTDRQTDGWTDKRTADSIQRAQHAVVR